MSENSKNSKYDYIIVGAGSAGCVVANRLSQKPHNNVLLLEAGSKDKNPFFRLPMLMGKLFQSGIYNWRYHTAPEPYLNNRSLYWPRGKVLGGSSTINGMIYIRGNKHDYDRWAQMGLTEWSYDKVLPAFRKSESHTERSGNFHGTHGELTVCRARSKNPMHELFVEAGVSAGYCKNDDFNGEDQEGMGRFDFTIKDGKRCSTSHAFLRPIFDRKNLYVKTNALTEKLIIEDGRAIGVQCEIEGISQKIYAEKEIIVCAGTVNSPQLLLLSGIGPKEELAEHGVECKLDLPGVGKNLQDHVDCVMSWECTKPVSIYNNLRIDKITASIAKGMITGKGFATTFPYEAGALLKTREDLDAPDLQIHFMPALEKSANLHIPNPFKRKKTTEETHGFTLRIGPMNPQSRGEITLQSKNPKTPPKIVANYLQAQFDIDTMIEGIKIAREIMHQAPLAPYIGKELAAGKNIKTKADLTNWLRETAMTTFHPVGTCKMGVKNDPMAVVDGRLKVHGIKGLRIADASIMPIISTGNTNAPTIMIGEKLAEFIDEETTNDSRT